MSNEKMTLGHALIEWESAGLDDVPTESLKELAKLLENEVNNRSTGVSESLWRSRFKSEIAKATGFAGNKLSAASDCELYDYYFDDAQEWKAISPEFAAKQSANRWRD